VVGLTLSTGFLMAPQDWAAAYLQSKGYPLTPQNLDYLHTWQRHEGGATNNSATFNWLNSTMGKQYPSINSVGVRAYPDQKTGLSYLDQTLNNGRYPDIVKGLASGNPWAQPIADDLAVWVSGQPDSAQGRAYASRVMGSKGSGKAPFAASAPAKSSRGPAFAPQAQTPANVGRQMLLSMLSENNDSTVMSLLQQRMQSNDYAEMQQQVDPGFVAPQKGKPKAAPQGDWSQWVGKPETRQGPSAPHTPQILQFVGKVGQLAGEKLTPWGNESHSLTTVNGNRSAHADGMAADIPATGETLIRRGQAALIAAGMPEAEARKIRGGLFNVGGYQVIFNTQEGGDHTDHVHVGIRH
jgi:hypothetical protein